MPTRTRDGPCGAVQWVACATIVLAAHAAVLWSLPATPANPAPSLAIPIQLDLSPAAAPVAIPSSAPAGVLPPPIAPLSSPTPSPPVQPAAPVPPAAEALPSPPEPLPRPRPVPPRDAVRPPPSPLPLRRPTAPAPHTQPVVRQPVQGRSLAAPSTESPHPASSATEPGDAASASAAPVAASDPNAVPAWQGRLVGQLQRAKRYPQAARSAGDEGVSIISFTIDRAGQVLSVRLVRSSGSPALDEEAVALVHRAEPLPALPAEMPDKTVTLNVPIRFSLR